MIRLLTIAVVGLTWVSMSASAQTTPLGRAVANAANATNLRVGTGDAVQVTCGQLLASGDFDPNATGDPTSPEEDLFFRCNEMVQTANALNGIGGTTNNLGWNNAELAQAMQQLTGEEQGSNQRMATENSNGQFANIGMRLDAIQRGARATTGGVGLVLQGVPVIGGNAGEAGDDSPWGWFLNGAIGFGDHDATLRENEYDYDSYGATFGVDYQFASGLVWGGAVGYADFEVDFDAQSSPSPLTTPVSGGKIETDGWSVSSYVLFDVGRFSFDGVVIYGENDYDNDRAVDYLGADDGTGRGQNLVVNRVMSGDTDGDQFAIGATVGTDFNWGATNLFVDVGLSYLDASIDGYEETDSAVNGGLNLRYDDQDFDSLQSIIGGTLSRAFSTKSGVMMPYLRAEYRHEFENDSRDINAIYASQTTGSINPLPISTDDPDEDFFEVGVGLSAVFARNLQAFIDYRATLDLDDTTANLVTIGIRGTF